MVGATGGVVGRRALLLGGAATLVAGCGSRSEPAPEQDPQEETVTEVRGDLEVLNGLLELEEQSVALYARADDELVRRLHEHELEHVRRLEEAIRRMKGDRAPSASGTVEDGRALELARRVEETALAAYLDAMPKVNDGRVRGLLATIAATEAEHLAAVDGALGRPQAQAAFVAGRRSL